MSEKKKKLPDEIQMTNDASAENRIPVVSSLAVGATATATTTADATATTTITEAATAATTIAETTEGDDITLEAIEESLRNFADTTDTIAIPRKQRASALTAASKSTIAATTAGNRRRRSVEAIAQEYAPPGLEKAFEQLYRALSPCLLNNDNNNDNTDENNRRRQNASVFLQGPRGCGKTLLVKSCLKAMVEEGEENHRANFRPVFLTSMLHVPTQKNHPNAGAAAVVDEILRQLVSNCGGSNNNLGDDNNDNNNGSSSSSSRKRQKTELLRLRQTCFTNHLQLLTEILQIAAVDGIPILFVLDNVPQFPPLILYHLLDRIAGSSSGGKNNGSSGGGSGGCDYLALIGMTTHALTCLKTSGFVEKRIVSRVEGTSSLIHLPASVPQSVLPRMIQSKMPTILHFLVHQVFQNNNNNSLSSEGEEVLEALRRQVRLGKSTRWFCRVFSLALACLREDVRRRRGGSRGAVSSSSKSSSKVVNFCAYVREALEDFGVAVLVDSSTTTTSATAAHSSSYSRLSKTSLSVLQDLSTPQLLLVLAARRILARSSHHHHHHHHRNNTKNITHRDEDASCAGVVVLTLEGMLQEVIQKLYRGNPPPGTASPAVLKRAFLELLDLAVLRPALDHSGSGPWQYYEKSETTTTTTTAQQEALFGWDIRMRLPLHLTLDIHRDILPALDLKALTAPTAILEWGKKLNN